MKMARNSIISLVAACLIMAGVAGAAMAQPKNVIEITYGTPFGVDHPFSVTDRKLMAKVEKETNGQVKFKPYWGGAVIGGRDAVEELTQGAVDMAFVNPTTSKSGFPITKASFNFFYGVNNVDVGARVFRELLTKFPDIENDYKGMKVLCWGGFMNQLITRKPVRKIADLKGMRLIAYGDVAIALKELGVEGMSIPGAEAYVDLQKGIIDGTIIPVEALESMKFAEVAKYVSVINFYHARTGSRMMNLNKFNSLPSDVKKVIESNIEYYSREMEVEFEEHNQHAMDAGKKLGVEFIPLSQEEMTKFYAPIKTIAVKEAQELDAKGLPGTKILNEAQRLIQLYSK
ncbi:MAG TPA: TRAP transporter substrate-binding protein DctP [Syntrophorhabdaceae bacterium]|nr:TRAP transporter substrate-binding protein DctP [Syntrophorhabdaceae bacterium]